MTIPDILNEIETRAQGATEGPWWQGKHYMGDVFGPDNESVADCDSDQTADFIAHAREDVPRLVAALRVAATELRHHHNCKAYLSEDHSLCNCMQGRPLKKITAILKGE
jgi:hypothetical protein